MKKIKIFNAKRLLTFAALAITGVMGVATTTIGNENIETTEYKVERNEYLDTRGKGNLIGDFANIQDFMVRILDSESYFNKLMYVKGFDNMILVSAYQDGAIGDFRSYWLDVYSYVGNRTVTYLGRLESSEPHKPICKCDGMILVLDGDYYEKYGVSADGRNLVSYGRVKARDVNPTPIVLYPGDTYR